MASGKRIMDLPVRATLNGADLFEISQLIASIPTSVKMTLSDLASYIGVGNTLATVLANSPLTNGNNIVVSANDKIVTASGNFSMDFGGFGNALYLLDNTNTDLFVGQNQFIFNYNNTLTDTFDLDASGYLLKHTTLINLDTPSVKYNQQTASRVAILDSNKYLISADTTTYPSLTELSYVKGVTGPINSTYLRLAGGTMTGSLVLYGDAVSANEAVTYSQFNNALTGLKWKENVRAKSTNNRTLSGAQTIDGVVCANPNRVLLNDQTDPKENGIWVVSSGAWVRSSDADLGSELLAATVYIEAGGATNGGTQWSNNNSSAITIGATNITFVKIAGAGVYTNGTYLKLTGNVFDIDFTTFSTNQITEGGSNLYFTTARVDTQVATYTGDVTLSGTVFAIGAGKILNSMINSVAWSKITSTPTTLAGYGITDTTGQLLTGYVSGAGTVSASDSILGAIQKLNGNIGALVTGVSSVSGITNRITSTGGATPIIDISGSYVGQSSITTLGTVTTGTWTATKLAITYGGTNNNAATINGVAYFDSSKYTTISTFVFDGTNLGIGTVPDAILTVSKQTTIVAAVSGSTAHYIGLDGSPLRVTYDTHLTGTSGTAFMGRRSRGTAGSPSALAGGDDILSFNGRGYGTTGYAAASTGLIVFKANQTFTDTNMGTYASIYTTPDNSVTAAEALRITGAGVINAVNASGKYQINATDVLSATALGSGVVGSSLTSVGTIATGVWNGTALTNTYLPIVNVAHGGNGMSTVASGSIVVYNTLDTGTALTQTSGNTALTNDSGVIAWVTVTGTGAPVRAGSPTFTANISTPQITGTGASNIGLTLVNTVTASSGVAYGVTNSPTLSAAANGDLLCGLYLNPTFTLNSKTSTNSFGIGMLCGTAVIYLGNKTGSTTDPAIYLTSNTPSNSNYFVTASGTNTVLNHSSTTGNLSFAIGNTTVVTYSGANSASAVVGMTYTTQAQTNQTLNTNIPVWKIIGASKQKATGADALQYFIWYQTQTLTYVGASVCALAASLAVEYITGGANATIATSTAIYVPTKSLANTTTGIGIVVEAPTGATSNYSGKFTGGLGVQLNHLVGNSTAPTGAVGAGAGTSPSAVTFSANATDLAGQVLVTTGTLPTATGTVLTVTFNIAYGTSPTIMITPANAATALLSGATMVIATSTTTTFIITAGATGLVAATAYAWWYQVIQ